MVFMYMYGVVYRLLEVLQQWKLCAIFSALSGGQALPPDCLFTAVLRSSQFDDTQYDYHASQQKCHVEKFLLRTCPVGVGELPLFFTIACSSYEHVLSEDHVCAERWCVL